MILEGRVEVRFGEMQEVHLSASASATVALATGAAITKYGHVFHYQ